MNWFGKNCSNQFMINLTIFDLLKVGKLNENTRNHNH
jgi:hypothetical protein